MFEEEVSSRSAKLFRKELPRRNPFQPLFLLLGRTGLVAAAAALMWGCFSLRQPSELDQSLMIRVEATEWNALYFQGAEIVQDMLLN